MTSGPADDPYPRCHNDRVAGILCSCNASDDNPYRPLASLDSLQARPRRAGSRPFARTGPVRAARTVNAGLNSQLTVVVDTDAGWVFVRGLRWHQQAGWM